MAAILGWIGVFGLLIVTFSGNAEIYRCFDQKDQSIHYLSDEHARDKKLIKSIKDSQENISCEPIDKRTPAQKRHDAQVMKDLDEIDRALYRQKVKETAKFLNDVEIERHRLNK